MVDRVAEPRWTADELVEGVGRAIAAHDFPAVEKLIHLLASVDPDQAAQVLATIRHGINAAKREPVTTHKESANG